MDKGGFIKTINERQLADDKEQMKQYCKECSNLELSVVAIRRGI